METIKVSPVSIQKAKELWNRSSGKMQTYIYLNVSDIKIALNENISESEKVLICNQVIDYFKNTVAKIMNITDIQWGGDENILDDEGKKNFLKYSPFKIYKNSPFKNIMYYHIDNKLIAFSHSNLFVDMYQLPKGKKIDIQDKLKIIISESIKNKEMFTLVLMDKKFNNLYYINTSVDKNKKDIIKKKLLQL